MVKRRHNLSPLRLFVGTTPTLKETVGATSCSVFSVYSVNVVGNGSVCILECKVLFILQEVVPVSKGKCLPVGFSFLFYNL